MTIKWVLTFITEYTLFFNEIIFCTFAINKQSFQVLLSLTLAGSLLLHMLLILLSSILHSPIPSLSSISQPLPSVINS